MIIIGGTYSEYCYEPEWDQIYGSGFRAVSLIAGFDDNCEIEFVTCGDKEVSEYLSYFENQYKNLSVCVSHINKSPEFVYDQPLKTPCIYPRADVLLENIFELPIQGENVLAYGLIEAHMKVNGGKVVYDPQSPANPKSYKSTGSTAKQLVIIINYSESMVLTGSNDIEEIKNYFFEEEKCFALILKMGSQGALLFETIDKAPIELPVYLTKKIWPIGSGDVFSAFFAYNWFQGKTLKESGVLASKATAIYCSNKDLAVKKHLEGFNLSELHIKKTPSDQIYLAGPFFNMAERWMVNEVRNTLMGMGLRVFSPFHDIGIGNAEEVVAKDIDAIDSSSFIFAIVDGLDSGTLFEIGYAISKGKMVLAFVQNESEESLKMLHGNGCMIEKDFTTAIYKTYWALGTK